MRPVVVIVTAAGCSRVCSHSITDMWLLFIRMSLFHFHTLLCALRIFLNRQ